MKITGTISIDLEDMSASFYKRFTGFMPDKVSDSLIPSVKRALSILSKHKIKATIFVLGWVAEKCPEIVRECSDAGHEIASHGYSHLFLENISRQEIKDDLNRASDSIYAATGRIPLGYRAPEFSLVKILPWGLEVIVEEGFAYDSSLFPGNKLRYGAGDIPHTPYEIKVGEKSIKEFPISAVSVPGTPLFLSGGTHLRILPSFLLRKTIHKLQSYPGGNRVAPLNIYLHPYEFRNEPLKCDDMVPDEYKPSFFKRLIINNYWNVFQSRMCDKIEWLLSAVEWRPFGERCKDEFIKS